MLAPCREHSPITPQPGIVFKDDAAFMAAFIAAPTAMIWMVIKWYPWALM